MGHAPGLTPAPYSCVRCTAAAPQTRRGDKVYIANTEGGEVQELAFPSMKLVRGAAGGCILSHVTGACAGWGPSKSEAGRDSAVREYLGDAAAGAKVGQCQVQVHWPGAVGASGIRRLPPLEPLQGPA